MSKVTDALRVWGCDVDGAMERMADDEEFYMECLQSVADDPYFSRLKTALDKKDIPGGFDAAHTLKGVLANVGLTPMFDQVVKIVTPLRAGSDEDLSGLYQQLMEMKAHLDQILRGG